MVTNDERREVARRLRELPGDSTYPDLIGVIADRDGWYPAADAADRLADLIEPSASATPTPLRRDTDASATLQPSQRDALLALADEMDEATCDKRGEMSISLGDVWGWAECIHEACGEVSDDADR